MVVALDGASSRRSITQANLRACALWQSIVLLRPRISYRAQLAADLPYRDFLFYTLDCRFLLLCKIQAGAFNRRALVPAEH